MLPYIKILFLLAVKSFHDLIWGSLQKRTCWFLCNRIVLPETLCTVNSLATASPIYLLKYLIASSLHIFLNSKLSQEQISWPSRPHHLYFILFRFYLKWLLVTSGTAPSYGERVFWDFVSRLEVNKDNSVIVLIHGRNVFDGIKMGETGSGIWYVSRIIWQFPIESSLLLLNRCRWV